MTSPTRGRIARRVLFSVLLLTGVLLASLAHAADLRVRVRVVDRTADRIYLSAGQERGLRTGTRVRFGRRVYRVASVTEQHAVVRVRSGRMPRLGARGVAFVRPVSEGGRREPPRLASLQELRALWPVPVHPATTQDVRPVWLGAMGTDKPRTLQLVIASDGGATIPLGERGNAIGRAALRTRLHYQPWSQGHAWLDASVQGWFASDLPQRRGQRSRPLVQVRRLELAYGDAALPYLALGRMPYAALGLGPLDGARVRTPSWGGLSLAAFGGTLPDPENGMPLQTAAARFGVEALFAPEDSDLRPQLELSVQGSTFQGAVDEQRLRLRAGIAPGPVRLGGDVELARFEENNPYGAPRIDLAHASLDASVRKGIFSMHARGDLRKPERSRFIASYLPPEWLCRALPTADPLSPEPCGQAYDARVAAASDMQLTFERWQLALGGNGAHRMSSAGGLESGGGYVQTRVLDLGPISSTTLALEGQHTWFVQDLGVRLELAKRFAGGRGQVDAAYRPARVLRRWDRDPALQHGARVGLVFSPVPALAWRTDAHVIVGAFTEVLTLHTSLAWTTQR